MKSQNSSRLVLCWVVLPLLILATDIEAKSWRLEPVAADDAPFAVVENESEQQWQTPPGSAHRLAFDVPADFPGDSPAWISVEYLEYGLGDLNVRYDGAQDAFQNAEKRFGYRQFDGRKEREATFYLDKPLFSGRQGGADFAVEALLEGGRLTVSAVRLHDAPTPMYNAWTAEPWLDPCTGPTRNDVDATTLDGKILCGYQGWFNAPYDGTDMGYRHWSRDAYRLTTQTVTVDVWPDASGYAPEDLHAVKTLPHKDGTPARIYSAFRRGPVLKHFEWMREHGIDGVFLSRFTIETISPDSRRHVNTVLRNVREGAHREGRVWAMMIDVSGPAMPTSAVKDDWKFLVDKIGVREDPRYLKHEGEPVVLLWGFGFPDREWTVAQALEVIDFFQNDPKYGGVYLIGGTPAYWRELKWDAREEKEWSQVYKAYDAISPWSAGRYDLAKLDEFSQNVWAKDLEVVKARGQGYTACAYPGFSWRNLMRTEPGVAYFARERGEFLRQQFLKQDQLGIRTTFVGMFDEIDEGTAIYKATNDPPAGAFFIDYEGQPGDHYLRITGEATKRRRALMSELPAKSP